MLSKPIDGREMIALAEVCALEGSIGQASAGARTEEGRLGDGRAGCFRRSLPTCSLP